jgi:hypothetical protein
MRQPESKPEVKKRYEPPTIVEVHVDPQKELLMATGCAFAPTQSPACDNSPGT